MVRFSNSSFSSLGSFFKCLSPLMRPWASYLCLVQAPNASLLSSGFFFHPHPHQQKRKNKIQLNPMLILKCLLTTGLYDHCPTLRDLEQTDLSIWQKFILRAVLGQRSIPLPSICISSCFSVINKLYRNSERGNGGGKWAMWWPGSSNGRRQIS